MYTIMMTRCEVEYGSERQITQEFYCANTLVEAKVIGTEHAWMFIDEEGYYWELYLDDGG